MSPVQVPDVMTSTQAKVERLERQLAIADVAGEAIIQDRDRLQRELAAMTKERDEARSALPQPVYLLLAEITQLRAEAELVRQNRDQRLREAVTEARGFKDQNRRLVSELEDSRRNARALETRWTEAQDQLQEAQARVLELAVGVEPDSPILREKNARTRAIEAAAAAELSAEAADLNGAKAFAAVAAVWTQIAQLPEKRSND